jgi:hypothetical protein
MRLLRAHKVIAEAHLGVTPRGESYAAPVEVRCFLDLGGVVMTTANTEVAEQQTRIYAAPKYAAALAPKSRVTLPDGTRAVVAKAVRRDGGGLLRAVAHVEVHLQ